MKLVACMPVRNEEWSLGLTARAALMWCDELIVGLHACTDTSETICDQIQDGSGDRLFYMDLDGEVWDEMQHRQALLRAARLRGATHIAIIDADEILTGNLLTVDDPLENSSPLSRCKMFWSSDQIFQMPGYNLRGSLNQYHNNGIWGNRWFSVAFADDPRLGWSGDKFHSREPQGVRLNNYRPIQQGQGGVMHLWGASERRLIAKHALYKITERLRWSQKKIEDIDAMYNLAIKGDPKNFGFGVPSAWTYSETKPEWWLPYASLIEHLDVNATPWQEEEVWRLVKEHGPRMFQGLDLFGLV